MSTPAVGAERRLQRARASAASASSLSVSSCRTSSRKACDQRARTARRAELVELAGDEEAAPRDDGLCSSWTSADLPMPE